MFFCHIETVREAVRICVEDLKQFDIASFEIKLRISRVTPDKFWSIKNMLVFFLTFGGSQKNRCFSVLVFPFFIA